jgi:hypothetical protein
MVTDDKISRLVEKLHQQTLDGKVKWEKTAGPGCFLTVFPDYGVRVRTREMIDDPIVRSRVAGSPLLYQEVADKTFVVLEIVNTNGVVIEEAKAFDVPRLPSLYELARRQALDVEKAVDDLLAALERGVSAK